MIIDHIVFGDSQKDFAAAEISAETVAYGGFGQVASIVEEFGPYEKVEGDKTYGMIHLFIFSGNPSDVERKDAFNEAIGHDDWEEQIYLSDFIGLDN